MPQKPLPDLRGKRPDEQALQHIKVSTKHLPPNNQENYYKRANMLRKRRYRTRDAMIYRAWLLAEDKTAEVKSLAERWGINEKRILKIVCDQRDLGSTVAAFKAEVEAIRMVKAGQAVTDADEYWQHLHDYIRHLVDLKEGGQKSVMVEETIQDGDKTFNKTVNVPIDEAISRAYEMRAKAAKMTSESLANYLGRPQQDVNIKDSNIIVMEADAEFRRQFSKIVCNKQVDAEYEVEGEAS